MDEEEVTELDREVRQTLIQSGLGQIVEEVDRTIAEGRSETEKRKIGRERPSDELVGVDYTGRERYELLLDAVRRAVIEPAAFEESIQVRLLEKTDAISVTFVDPNGDEVRRLGESIDAGAQYSWPTRRQREQEEATRTADILLRLDVRSAPDPDGTA